MQELNSTRRRQRPTKAICHVYAGLAAAAMALGIATASAAQTLDPQEQPQSLWPESLIGCSHDEWEITVEDPDGQPVTIRFARSKLMLCGWMMDGWEMFVFDKRGCLVRPEDRWWMRGVDAARVRECFR